MDDTKRAMQWISCWLDPSTPMALRQEAMDRLLALSPAERLSLGERFGLAHEIGVRPAHSLCPISTRIRSSRLVEEVASSVGSASTSHPAGWRVPADPSSGEFGWIPACRRLVLAEPGRPGTLRPESLESAWLPFGAIDAWTSRHPRATLNRSTLASAWNRGVGLPLGVADSVVRCVALASIPEPELERALGRIHAGVGLLVDSDSWLPLPLQIARVVARTVGQGEVVAPDAIRVLERVAWYWTVVAFVAPGLRADWARGRTCPSRWDTMEVMERLRAEITPESWAALPSHDRGAIQRMEHWLVAGGLQPAV